MKPRLPATPPTFYHIMAANRLVTASDALKKFFKNVVAPWASQTGMPDVDMLQRKLVRNMAIWFAASPAPYRAMHSFYVSGDECTMVTFLMFLSVATKTGGLGTEEMARDMAEDVDHEIGLWMARVRDAPSDTTEDDLRMVLRKASARLMDDARQLAMEPVPDDGKRALPDAEKVLQKDLALVASIAIRLAFMTGNIHNFRDSMRALRQFSAGPGTPPPSPDRATEQDTDPAEAWAKRVVEDALAGVSKHGADALARASAAEQLAEDAEKMAVDAGKKAIAAEKRVAKAEKRVADLERRVGDMHSVFVASMAKSSTDAAPDATPDVYRRLEHLELTVAASHGVVDGGLMDRVARLESAAGAVDGGLMNRVAHVESAVVGVSGLQAGLARVQAEMGWLLPQFRLQFCHHWNGVMALWQMQHDLHTPYIPPPEFMPKPSV